jgi:uncharacterized surface protein with fasciclin (FAS1) repeats
LEKRLRSQDSFTLFAPVDIAFAYLTPETFTHLLRAENQGILSKVLGYHVLPTRIMSRELRELDKAKTIYGTHLAIDGLDEIRIEGAKLLHTDILACNGVIHGIDRLLMPEMAATAASR